MIEKGAFLEWAEVHGHLYGSSIENLRRLGYLKSLLFEVDCKGAKKIRQECKEAVLIFVMTPSIADLIRRIQGRGAIRREDLCRRIRTATLEIRQVADFDYLVINDRFSEAVNELQSIILAESCRGRYLAPFWGERWAREIDDEYPDDPST